MTCQIFLCEQLAVRKTSIPTNSKNQSTARTKKPGSRKAPRLRSQSLKLQNRIPSSATGLRPNSQIIRRPPPCVNALQSVFSVFLQLATSNPEFGIVQRNHRTARHTGFQTVHGHPGAERPVSATSSNSWQTSSLKNPDYPAVPGERNRQIVALNRLESAL